jgi:hypothetical protein
LITQSTQQPAITENTLVLSPNPVRDQLFLRGYEKVQTLTVYDLAGHEILTINKPGSTINIQQLKSGVYIIKMNRTDNSQKTVKILKQ